MDLSPQFLARLCWVIDGHFTNLEYQKNTLRECVQIQEVLDATTIDIENSEVAMFTCLTRSHKRINLVVFKSTDSEADWKENFDIRLVTYPPQPRCCGCSFFTNIPLVHNGYVTQYTRIKSDLLSYLGKHPDVDYTIFTGFSLGGGMATLVSYLTHVPNTITIVFGNPRIGNASFVKAFTKMENLLRHERWVFNNDPIPRLPPGILYRHIPGIKLIRDDSDTIHEVENCSCLTLFKSNTEDHNLLKYLDKIDHTSIFS